MATLKQGFRINCRCDALWGPIGIVVGDMYPIVTFASRSGSFATAILDPASISFDEAFVTHYLAASVTLEGILDTPDLRVASVDVMTPTVHPGEAVTVQYTVTNDGRGTASGKWVDAVYLSNDNVVDTSDTLLDAVEHNGPLASGDSYTGSFTVSAPPLAARAYRVIVRADIIALRLLHICLLVRWMAGNL